MGKVTGIRRFKGKYLLKTGKGQLSLHAPCMDGESLCELESVLEELGLPVHTVAPPIVPSATVTAKERFGGKTGFYGSVCSFVKGHFLGIGFHRKHLEGSLGHKTGTMEE
ncbi:hypothetical protein OOZ15_19645 [Galbibacter sp. EGI 63066]|uniref:hypothetical protein n=1 Tax=Galbibacter sp. EGI 63066 TaxID=2993559 RepID=UPI002249A114|nr:hypothetical protein [Galbibacter sp. EGI 63066]MCX2682164.1 hypothetical protein [Galbibacter sp. EGI 63066]